MYCWMQVKNRVERLVRDYDSLQFWALIFIYIQIGCSLVGSLGALYNGLLMANLGIALFALVAIESSSQSLGRTYAVLLLFSILLDIVWFILFSRDIWTISLEDHGSYFVFAVKLTLVMQIIGFCVRLSSTFLWIQIYRLGISTFDRPTLCRDSADYDDTHNSFLTPSGALPRQCSDSDVVLGGSIYDPIYYSSLFEYPRNSRSIHQNQVLGSDDIGSSSISNVPQMKVCLETTFAAINEESEDKPLHV